MQRPVSGQAPPPPQDTTPPSAPSGLTSSTTGGSATLSWTAASDNVGVVRYNVHRSTTSGFTPATASRIGQPTATSYVDSGLAAGTYYYRVTAEDAAGNISAPTAALAVTVPAADTAPPSAPSGLSASTVVGSATVSWTAATDNVGVARYNVHRSTTAGLRPRLPTESVSPPARATPTRGSPAGTYYYRVTAEDAAGNVSAPSAQLTATVPAAAATAGRRPGRGVRAELELRVDRHRFVGPRQCGRGLGCGVECGRSVWVGVELRWGERLGDGGGLGVARPVVGDDRGGVGAAVEGWRLAHGCDQGASGRNGRTRCTAIRAAHVRSGRWTSAASVTRSGRRRCR